MGRGTRRDKTSTVVARPSKKPPYVPPVTVNHHVENFQLMSEQTTAGAKRVSKLLTAQQLSTTWRSHPDNVFVISDVHSDVQRLHNFLQQLGAVDSSAERLHTGRLVQIGDLMDGRDANDMEALHYGQRVFDTILAGNHEGAYVGGKTFSGAWTNPELERELSGMIRFGTLDAAMDANGVLLVHGGAHPQHWSGASATEVAEALNTRWQEFYYRRGETPPDELFEHTQHGGRGGMGKYGGALWCDWRQLVDPEAHPLNFRQIVGHSPLGYPETSLDDQTICIDTAGPRLGAAVIEHDGTIHVGSDQSQEVMQQRYGSTT